jgi:hypothetical protein
MSSTMGLRDDGTAIAIGFVPSTALTPPGGATSRELAAVWSAWSHGAAKPARDRRRSDRIKDDFRAWLAAVHEPRPEFARGTSCVSETILGILPLVVLWYSTILEACIQLRISASKPEGKDPWHAVAHLR